ncbi:calcium-binding protein [Jannaschia ovalis]|uniref:Calcium-binding protein n=1 Tax=Jannaschia ovalis TaxID=3038773 RepID=A0ABY8LBE0_9RHOB|nr:calcium-binding protein [Jannaschia sp. GRR-S6-38]WGH78591.1 calcium-binding protein [Jannaschia sp. GRR-S6-38]
MLKIETSNASGHFSSSDHFHTNLLPLAHTGSPSFATETENPDGKLTLAMENALDHFGSTAVRFPGGMPDKVFEDGMLPGGGLAPEIATFLADADSKGLSVSFVVPVDAPLGQTRDQFLDDLQDFVTIVSDRFPGVVESYQLGNEYWAGRTSGDASLEEIYGRNAAEATNAIAEGLGGANAEANIFIQASGNLRGAFGNDPRQANEEIQNAFSQVPGATDELDGVVRNFYWKDPDEGGFENDSGAFREDRALPENLASEGVGGWEDWLQRDLQKMVGEYNINLNLAIGDDAIDIGRHGASMLLEHYTNLVEADVDTAFVWPLIHNTQNAFLNKEEEIQVVSVAGLEISTNSTRGAMFDVIRQTVGDHELVDVSWSFLQGPHQIEVTAFESRARDENGAAEERIVFLSSRSEDVIETQIDLSQFSGDYLGSSGIRIGYEDIGGNHRDAKVSLIDTHDLVDGIGEISLAPYEVVQITFERPFGSSEPEEDSDVANPEPSDTPYVSHCVQLTWREDHYRGLELAEEVHGRGGHDRIFGNGGDDTIFGHMGDDTIDGGVGNDEIGGGHGDDVLWGGAGNDRINGKRGEDTIYGEAGDDHIIGDWGRDLLDGGLGHDTIFGRVGQDTINGGGGRDIIDGQRGDDVLNGGRGVDVLTGGHGNDIFVFQDLDRGFDRITDFTRGEDSIQLSAPEIDGMEDLRFIPYDRGASVLIRFEDEAGEQVDSWGGIVIEDYDDQSSFEHSDFVFF